MFNRSDKDIQRLLRDPQPLLDNQDPRCTDQQKALAEDREKLAILAELIYQPEMDVLALSLSPMRMAAVI